jgi:hypothetical protein
MNWKHGGSLRDKGIGHIVLVKEVLAEPQLKAAVGEGFHRIHVQTLEASGAGAESRSIDAQCGGAAGSAAGGTGFIRLHLFEVQPGGDPDTLQGLRKLNVRRSNDNLLHTADERAPRTRLTHNSDGTTRPAGRCCQDDQQPLVPTRDGTEVAC